MRAPVLLNYPKDERLTKLMAGLESLVTKAGLLDMLFCYHYPIEAGDAVCTYILEDVESIEDADPDDVAHLKSVERGLGCTVPDAVFEVMDILHQELHPFYHIIDNTERTHGEIEVIGDTIKIDMEDA